MGFGDQSARLGAGNSYRGVASVVVALWAARSSSQSARTSRQQLRAASRPVLVTNPYLPERYTDAEVGDGILVTLRNIGVGPALDIHVVTMLEVYGSPEPAKHQGPFHLSTGASEAVFLKQRYPISGINLEVRLFYGDTSGTAYWSAFSYWRRGVSAARTGVGLLPETCGFQIVKPNGQVDHRQTIVGA